MLIPTSDLYFGIFREMGTLEGGMFPIRLYYNARIALLMSRHSFTIVLHLGLRYWELETDVQHHTVLCPLHHLRQNGPSSLFDTLVCKREKKKWDECNNGPRDKTAFTLFKAYSHGSIHWTKSVALFIVRSVSRLVKNWVQTFYNLQECSHLFFTQVSSNHRLLPVGSQQTRLS